MKNILKRLNLLIIKRRIKMTTDEHLNAEADSYTLKVFGEEVYSNPEFSESVSACKEDFKQGVTWALGLSRNLIPRLPHPNRPR